VITSFHPDFPVAVWAWAVVKAAVLVVAVKSQVEAAVLVKPVVVKGAVLVKVPVVRFKCQDTTLGSSRMVTLNGSHKDS